MIIRSLPAGRSFKWLAEYLGHDPKAQTADRLAWTQTFNLAHDHIGSAVDEMLHTYLDRNLLKAEAGIRKGGSSLEKPVKHVSLSWDPSEKISKDEMVATAASFMKAQGWQDHQYIVWSHVDKAHFHVHLMINMVHPERGTRLRDGYEWHRAEAWGLAYEQSRGKVFCENRLKPKAEREPSPPRNVWEQLRALQEYRSEPSSPDAPIAAIDYAVPPREWQKQEWLVLKLQQKAERLAFFEDGRKAYGALRRSVYSEVRTLYRREWADYFALMKVGAPKATLAMVKAELIARQAETLQAKCKEAATVLRADRDAVYEHIKQQQKAGRAELADRQENGLTSAHLIYGTPASSVPHVGKPVHPAPIVMPPLAAPTLAPSQAGFHWAARPNLVSQQRSARRWLDRAIDRLARPATAQRAPPRQSLAAAAERLTRKDERQEIEAGKSIRPVGIEPDL